MRKRERENPCGICGHYHKYEEGEVCGVCGHRMAGESDKLFSPAVHGSAFPSEILPEFLYLGSYDNASRAELLKAQGITRVLNTVPECQNLYKNSFTYHCLQYDQKLPFDDAIQFLEQCEKDRARVLVHCMSGKNRSPAIVMSFLMKSKGWRLRQSYQWVKERRPSVDINEGIYHQLQEFEHKLFGTIENANATSFSSLSSSSSSSSFSFGFSMPSNPTISQVPTFNSARTSIFSPSLVNVPPQGFTFGAGQTEKTSPTFNDVTMDGS